MNETNQGKISDEPGAQSYRQIYSEREPDRTKIQNSDETIALTEADGLIDFPRPGFPDYLAGNPPSGTGSPGNHTFLWVIEKNRIPVIIELCNAGRRLQSRVIKHTNLTGGARAYCGGEIWFTDDRSFYLSGGSGRYPPRSEQELEAVVNIFASCGYGVTGLGWDHDTDAPARFLRG